MKLFHHFQTCTSHTLIFGTEVWEQAIKLSFDSECLTHAILCVSARHHAFLTPEEPKYAAAAAAHLCQALHLFREALSAGFTPANVDIFLTTAILIQFEIWTNIDFVSFGSDGISLNASWDRMFELSLGLQQIFHNSLPHVFEGPSVFVKPARYSPRTTLVRAATISRCTLDLFMSHFDYARPMEKGALQTPLPFKRGEDLAPEECWMYHSWHLVDDGGPAEESYIRALRRLCLLMSFLPEAQGDRETSHGLTDDLVSDYARYVFLFPVLLLERPLIRMTKQRNPKALLLLYHYFRCIRVLLPRKECWWAQKRASISEMALWEILEKQCSMAGQSPT
ncbi:hypothetical protein NKR23_g5655 [Pleurostoma richardsiae]|uniref:Uncharacterized protein n=1 Tax=Pleurostoma richardsiae TaxID=41990 RepID=A0AA38RD36_9PEZI|nr:hypothetical protein NKR23_g5655 [Pleurostoma richardsiae]